VAGKRRRRFERQAERAGQQRYRPEQEALGLLERDTRRDFRDTRASSRTAADSIAGSAREGRQTIEGIYEDAGLTDLVRAGLESNPAARRVAEEMAEAETEMVHREVDAREGASFAVREARKQRDRSLTDINRRRTSLAGQKGEFVADLVQQLIGEDNAARAQAQQHQADQQFEWDKQTRSLMQSERSSLRSSGVNPDTGKKTSGSKSKPTGADRDASAALGKAKTWLNRLDNDGYKKTVPDRAKRRAGLGELLVAGDQASGVPALPQHVVEAALDMHFAGRLSPATVKMLRTLGIQVRRLPGVTFGPRPGSSGVVQAPGANGQQRPT
jgi:hypothetical protein